VVVTAAVDVVDVGVVTTGAIVVAVVVVVVVLAAVVVGVLAVVAEEHDANTSDATIKLVSTTQMTPLFI